MLRLFDRLNLTPAERRLVVGVLAVAFIVVNYWIVWPRFGDFAAIVDNLESMARKEEIYRREIARRPIYEALLRQLQSEGSVVPAGEERIQFLADMERLARDVGLQVPRWGEVLPERSGTSSNAFFETIGLSMQSVSGTEPEFVDFLYRVGASNSTIRVKELTLTPGNFDARSQGRTNLVGTLKLVASVQKNPTAPVAPAGPGPAHGATSAPAAVATPPRGTSTVSTATAPSRVPSPTAASAAARSNLMRAPVRLPGASNAPAR